MYSQFDLEGLGHHSQVADVIDTPDGSVGPRVVVPPQNPVLHLRRDALRLHERLRLILVNDLLNLYYCNLLIYYKVIERK